MYHVFWSKLPESFRGFPCLTCFPEWLLLT